MSHSAQIIKEPLSCLSEISSKCLAKAGRRASRSDVDLHIAGAIPLSCTAICKYILMVSHKFCLFLDTSIPYIIYCDGRQAVPSTPRLPTFILIVPIFICSKK